ncbi:unnamed protein product [Callosobruchus maculatus]|uniref:Tetraspanin n=1 Tax=Callosobruchus maculatus TaxID=64391 RepID=A0A653DK06_CALMS|nr:unnamed protein product [Callosobruchus maculatus]
MDLISIMRTYARYLLIIFNLIFSLTGIIIISVGLSAKAYFHEFDTLLDNKYFYVSDFLIVIGVIIFMIAFFGCCGAMKENVCMTTTFSTLLVIVFILELVVGIAGFLLKSRTEEFLIDNLHKTMDQYNSSNTEITVVWDQVQRQLHCCGVVNATDWINSTSTQHKLPMSCCPIPAGTTDYFNCTPKAAYPEGCLEVFGDYIKSNITYVEGVAIGLSLIQMLGIILSCSLAKIIRSDYETV